MASVKRDGDRVIIFDSSVLSDCTPRDVRSLLVGEEGRHHRALLVRGEACTRQKFPSNGFGSMTALNKSKSVHTISKASMKLHSLCQRSFGMSGRYPN